MSFSSTFGSQYSISRTYSMTNEYSSATRRGSSSIVAPSPRSQPSTVSILAWAKAKKKWIAGGITSAAVVGTMTGVLINAMTAEKNQE